MFLFVKKVKGHRYLQLVESVHVPGKPYPEKRVIKNYGNFDKVPDDVRAAYEDKKKRKLLAQRLESELRAKELQKCHDELSAEEPSDGGNDAPRASENFNKAFNLRYGHLALKSLWEKDLGLKYKIGYLQRSATDIKSWQLNDLLFYLCSLKAMEPMSYLGACENKSDFFYCPWNGVAQDNFYRALDFVYDHREALISHAVKTRMDTSKTQVKVAFFDCTNTWFETPYDDVTWQIIRFTRRIREELQKQNMCTTEIEEFIGGEEFARMLSDELSLREEDVLRMRGCSKEGRYAQPIVTVALAIDQTGFPIDCKVFAGNLSELRTIKPMLDSLSKKYAVSDVYFVADRGLNSTESLEAIRQEKLGFVVAQKVSRQTPQVRRQMLDLKGYRNCRIDDNGDFVAAEESDELHENAFRFKVCDLKKSSYIENKEAGTTKSGNPRKKKITVDCKVIFTYSPERKQRDLADLEEQIAKATAAVNSKRLMGNANGTGWRSLVQTNKEAAENKEDKELYRAVGLKKEVIAERREIAGYAAVVYSHPDKEDGQKFTDEQVLATYHKLVAIEDCFRVMKSSFSIRPVYVRLKERITAHCYLCVLSLMLLKLLQEKLQIAQSPMSVDRITAALSQAFVIPLAGKEGKVSSLLNAGLHPTFYTPERVDKGIGQSGADDVLDHDELFETYKQERERKPDDIDQILKAVDLKPLGYYNSLGEVKRRLKVQTYSDNVLIAPEHMEYLKRVATTI